MRLTFARDELLDHPDYATSHVVNGRRLHGGFDRNGNYLPPRTKTRRVATDNWALALRERGFDLLEADS